MALILPESVEVRLKRADGSSVKRANVILRIDTVPTMRCSMHLFPFVTGPEGVAHIYRADLKAEISATYESGLMDYSPLETAEPWVIIRVCTKDEIDEAITSRTSVWKSLLDGEDKRWKSIDQLIGVLRSAANGQVEPMLPLKALWGNPNAKYTYDIQVRDKGLV